MKVLLTGGKGQLGQSLNRVFPSDWVILSTDKVILDISIKRHVYEAICSFKPDIIINTAAFTSVDAAENDVESSKLVNFFGAKYIACAAQKYGSKLIHISTDYVFDGKTKSAYKEIDKPQPLNIYGSTKLAGELFITENNVNSYIIRTSWIYSEYGKNFLKSIYNLLLKKKNIHIVGDQIGCPTYAPHIADLIIAIIKNNTISPGLYHFCGDKVISWYDFACEIAHLMGADKSLIMKIDSKDYKFSTIRPSFSALSCKKLERYGYKRSNFLYGITRSIDKLMNFK